MVWEKNLPDQWWKIWNYQQRGDSHHIALNHWKVKWIFVCHQSDTCSVMLHSTLTYNATCPGLAFPWCWLPPIRLRDQERQFISVPQEQPSKKTKKNSILRASFRQCGKTSTDVFFSVDNWNLTIRHRKTHLVLHKKIHPSFLLVSEWCLSNVRIPHGHAVRRFLPRLFKKNETVGNIWELSTPKLQPVSKNKGKKSLFCTKRLILYDCDRSGWANLNWTSNWEILNHYFLDSLAGNVLSPMMNNSLKNPDSHVYLGQMIYMKW